MVEEDILTKNYKKSEKLIIFGDFYVFLDVQKKSLTIIAKFR